MLVVLQALDAAGKDGTIRHVMSGVNPQGVAVHSFKVPVAPRSSTTTTSGATRGDCPRAARSGSSTAPTTRRCSSSGCTRRSSIARSCPTARRSGDVWKRRYREINDWERYLTDNGIRIVKLFLNLSEEEQRTRFLRRIDLPDHNWKFSTADVKEREHWDDYQKAFSEMLSHTSTEWAPWYVIPADRKWFARIGAGAVLVHALMEIDPRFPKVTAAAARGAARDQAGARGAGAGGRRARPVRREPGRRQDQPGR